MSNLRQFHKPGPPIDGHQWLKFLGRGGAGEVHHYRQNTPERDVAIKIPYRTHPTDHSGVLTQEANILASISTHPGVISLFGTGHTTTGAPWISLEYCQGPLWARQDAPLSVHLVLRGGVGVAGALASLHALGFAHRDVKPSNILMTAFDQPVLSDFGLASPIGASLSSQRPGMSVPWTPPEILARPDSALPVSPSQDVYSLAATLWTWLVGHSPVEIPGQNLDIEEARNISRTQPYRSTGRRDVPASLEDLLRRGLSANPTDRPQMADMGKLLQQIQLELGLPLTNLDILSFPLPDLALQVPEGVTDPDPDATIVPGATPQQFPAANRFAFTGDHSSHRSLPQPYLAQDSSADSNELTGRRFSWGTVTVFVALALIVAGLVLVVLRGGGWTVAPQPDPPQNHQDPDIVTVPQVTAVEMSHDSDADTIIVSWQPPEDLPDVTGSRYLYRVERSGLDNIQEATSQTTISFPAVEGSNCIEVMVRGERGKISPPTRQCLTP